MRLFCLSSARLKIVQIERCGFGVGGLAIVGIFVTQFGLVVADKHKVEREIVGEKNLQPSGLFGGKHSNLRNHGRRNGKFERGYRILMYYDNKYNEANGEDL